MNYYSEIKNKLIKNEVGKKTREKLINNNNNFLEIADNLKDPIILYNKTNYNKISEFALKEIVMNDLDNFLKQLG